MKLCIALLLWAFSACEPGSGTAPQPAPGGNGFVEVTVVDPSGVCQQDRWSVSLDGPAPTPVTSLASAECEGGSGQVALELRSGAYELTVAHLEGVERKNVTIVSGQVTSVEVVLP